MTTVDDIDGSPADEAVAFSLDGVRYLIDLSEDHAAELRADMQKWIAHARRDTSRAPVRSRTVPTAVPAMIRRWAMDNGLEVSARGRISDTVIRAYRDATGH